jgi:heat shock protein HtpX
MPQEYYDAIAANRRGTLFLFSAFFILVLLLGFFVGVYIGSPTIGMIFTFMFGFVWTLISWFAGDKVLLSMSGAHKVEKKDYPYLFNTAEGLALAAGVPAPEVYVIDDPSPNAFATGRDPQHGKLAVTTGLLKMMNRQELEGVVAHEMSHIRNRDIRTMLLAAVLVGMVSMVGNVFLRMTFFGSNRNERKGGNVILIIISILFIIVAPIIAQIIKFAISRKREYLADASAVELTRNPDGIMNALKKLAADHTPLQRANGATASLYIEDPITRESGLFKSLNNLFSTHPPIEDRIKKLEEYARIG